VSPYSTPVFFNLFNEAEPFAAVLIAHGTRLFGGILRHEEPKFEGQERGEVLGRGSELPPHQLGGLGSTVRCLAPTANIFRTYKEP